MNRDEKNKVIEYFRSSVLTTEQEKFAEELFEVLKEHSIRVKEAVEEAKEISFKAGNEEGQDEGYAEGLKEGRQYAENSKDAK